MKQIAIGLEKKGQRFLWVVKSSPGNTSKKIQEEPDIEKLLPDWRNVGWLNLTSHTEPVMLDRNNAVMHILNTWKNMAQEVAAESLEASDLIAKSKKEGWI